MEKKILDNVSLPNISWWSMTTSQVEEKLETSTVNGLSSEEALNRIETYGFNEIQVEEKRPRWKVFLDQFKDVLIYILLIAAIISAILNYIENQHLGKDWIVISVIVILNAIIGFIQEGKADSAIEALMSSTAPEAHVIRDGKEITVKARNLVPGDVIILHEGDLFPADGRIFEESNLKAEEAALTGESVPISKHSQFLVEGTPLAERKNCIFSSTLATYGRGKAIVTQTGMTTEVGKIAGMISEAEEKLTPLQKNLEEFGTFLGKVILIICGLVSVIYLLQSYVFNTIELTWIQAIMAGVALAVAAIPEGLPAVVTTCLAIGVTRMSQRNAIIKKLHSVETLGCTSIICSDKTGTLTKNEMTVRSVWTGGKVYDVTGSGYSLEGKIFLNEEEVNPSQISDLDLTLRIGLLCNNARLSQDEKTKKWNTFGDPTEGCLITSAWKAGLEHKATFNKYERLEEIPFDSTRKRMTTINMIEGKKIAYVKGATEILLDLCDNILWDGQIRPITSEDKKLILEAYEKKASEALRGLGFAYREAEGIEVSIEAMEQHLTFVGMQFMIDPPRDEVKQAIIECKQAGIGVKMITGDNLITAKAIAIELGMIEEGDPAYEGKNIPDLTDEEILNCNVFARVSPEHKMDIVNAIQNQGEVAAMTGDGVNDAPALKNAHVGVAMGITGTDVSKEAAVMVLADDNFATIVHAVEEGRGIYDNIKKFVQYLLSSNIMEVLVLLFASLFGLSPPLIATQLLWVNLVTDGAPAIALGFDPYDPTLMQQKPRPLNEPLLTRYFIITMIYRGVVLTVWILGIFILYTNTDVFGPTSVDPEFLDQLANLEGYKSLSDWNMWAGEQGLTALEYEQLQLEAYSKWYARSVTFLIICFAEMANAFNCRSEFVSIFKIGFFRNKMMIYSVSLSLTLTLLLYFWSGLGNIFSVVPLLPIDWIWVNPTIIVTLGCVEILKVYFRKKLGIR